MNNSDRGKKHICPECASKYYDLKKEVVACPTCGAKPLVRKTSPATEPTKKKVRTKFRQSRQDYFGTTDS